MFLYLTPLPHFWGPLYSNHPIVNNKIGNRPGRIEPRKVKRRRKPRGLLYGHRKKETERLQRRKEKRESKNAMA